MENPTLTLAPNPPSEKLPNPGQYVFVLTTWGDLHYGFWHSQFNRFYWMGDSATLEEVQCWYEVPKGLQVG